MSMVVLFGIAVGLSMDAFAVSVCKGMSMQKRSIKKALIIGLYFGAFQALMPLLGYFLASRFADLVTTVSHWIAFGLLAFIGGKMIWDSRSCESDQEDSDAASIAFRAMFPLAIATSIDALAVGVTFAFLEVSILPAILLIGIVTFCFSLLGVLIGHLVGQRFQSYAELVGGIILILIGTKTLLEGLKILQ